MKVKNYPMGTCLYCGRYRIMQYHMENCPSPVMEAYMDYTKKRSKELRLQAAMLE